MEHRHDGARYLTPRLVLGAQRSNNSKMRAALDMLTHGTGIRDGERHVNISDFYLNQIEQKAPDPMQITLNMIEIANGVLLTGHNGGPFAETTEQPIFYASWEDAFDALRAHADSLKKRREIEGKSIAERLEEMQRNGSASNRAEPAFVIGSQRQVFPDDPDYDGPIMPDVVEDDGDTTIYPTKD